MTLDELEKKVPALHKYTAGMPEILRSQTFITRYAPGEIIHHKDTELPYFGIVAEGENRAINQLKNGKVFMIEINKPIDFIGEVTILAHRETTSVTIQAVTASTVVYLPRRKAEEWLDSDPVILRKVASHVAFKLYRSSYNNGLNMFYPPTYILADYLVRTYEQMMPDVIVFNPEKKNSIVIPRTHEWLEEELGMNIKTLERAIRALRDQGYFDVVKGKISINFEQYMKLKDYLEAD